MALTELVHSPQDLQQIYRARFAGQTEYRTALWHMLCRFFAQWIPADSTVLDLGCGYCEFINNVAAARKFGLDLNPDAHQFASPDVQVLLQNSSVRWQLEAESLDVVFTSNFFEHLPSKAALEETLRQAYDALKPGGRLIAMGPNIRHLPGAYWDFFDHYIALTDLSLAEVLTKTGFNIDVKWDRFLPYTMSQGKNPPLWMVNLFLKLPVAWSLFGKQFLVVSQKPQRIANSGA